MPLLGEGGAPPPHSSDQDQRRNAQLKGTSSARGFSVAQSQRWLRRWLEHPACVAAHKYALGHEAAARIGGDARAFGIPPAAGPAATLRAIGLAIARLGRRSVATLGERQDDYAGCCETGSGALKGHLNRRPRSLAR